VKFRSITAHGMGVLRDVSLSLDDYPGPLVAVRGRNGAGKSTLLELLLGALWRRCPTRGALTELATARDAFVEVAFEHGGQSFTVKQMVDAYSGKSEALLRNGSGRPLVESTKVSAVDAYVAEHFPPRDVLLVSTFAAQQSQGFIDASPGDRKALLLRMLGVERLEALAADAGERARGRERDLATLNGQLKQEVTANVTPMDQAEACLTQARAGLELAEDTLRVSRETLAAAESAERAAVASVEAQATYFRQRNALEDERKSVRGKLAEVETRLENNRALVARRPEIERACARAAELEKLQHAASTEHGTHEYTCRILESRLVSIRKSRAETVARRHQAEERARRRPVVDAAKREVARLTTSVTRLEADVEEKRLDALSAAEKGAADRITDLRVGLAAIRDSHSVIDAARETAAATLERDNAARDEASRVPALNQELRAAESALRSERGELMRHQRDAADEPMVVAAEADVAQCVAELDALLTETTETESQLTAVKSALADVLGRLSSYGPELEKLKPTVRLKQPLDVASARIEELGGQERELAAREAELEEKINALGEPPSAVPAPVPARVRSAVVEAERTQRSAVSRVAEWELKRTEAQRSAERRAELEERVAGAIIDVGDWRLLAADLGKNGLQATLIDAALPELQTMANSLLHANFGPRFTLELRTQAADSKGKRLIETLNVIVHDSMSGREALVETYSGGERAIISEGLSLALTTLASRESGLAGATLIRDEAGAALDAENGRAWVGMLRQAVAVMGADKLLFVSHSAELAELADSRIDL
jgi:DNA repair protein SbcC/Rad50